MQVFKWGPNSTIWNKLRARLLSLRRKAQLASPSRLGKA